MSDSMKIKEMLSRPVVVGLTSALGAVAMSQRYKVDLPLFGEIPAPVFYGLLGIGSSLATESLRQWVLPMLPQSDAAVQAENALLSPVLHAGVNIAVLKLAYPAILNDIGYQQPVLIGAGAEIVGTYAFDAFLKTWI